MTLNCQELPMNKTERMYWEGILHDTWGHDPYFEIVNEIYASYFNTSFPARETVEVANLPKFVNVEISMIAIR